MVKAAGRSANARSPPSTARVSGRKPMRAATTRGAPASRNTKRPAALVVVALARSVPTTATMASGSGAPLVSLTMPCTTRVACASAGRIGAASSRPAAIRVQSALRICCLRRDPRNGLPQSGWEVAA